MKGDTRSLAYGSRGLGGCSCVVFKLPGPGGWDEAMSLASYWFLVGNKGIKSLHSTVRIPV